MADQRKRWWQRPRSVEPESRALDSASAAPLLPVALGPAVSGEHGGVRGALSVADVYACVRCLSDAAASLPLHVFRGSGDARQRVTSGQLVDLLDAPSPATTQAGLVGQLVAHLNLHGNAYLAKYRDAGRIAQLALLDPSMVLPELEHGRVQYRIATADGQRVVGPEDVLHVRAPFSVDGLVGLSPIGARRAIAAASELASAALSLAGSGGVPHGLITVPADVKVSEEERQRLREQYESVHRGGKNAHRVLFAGGGADFKPISSTAVDLAWIDQRKLSTTEIARIFRVPAWMVGASSGDSMTYSNVEQQQLAFVMHSLRPWLVTIEQAITADRDLCARNVSVEFVIDALLRADHATRAQVYTAALDPETGWMTRDEVRRLENLPPEKAGTNKPQEFIA